MRESRAKHGSGGFGFLQADGGEVLADLTRRIGAQKIDTGDGQGEGSGGGLVAGAYPGNAPLAEMLLQRFQSFAPEPDGKEPGIFHEHHAGQVIAPDDGK